MNTLYALVKKLADFWFAAWKPGVRIMVAGYLILMGATILAGGGFAGLPGLNMTLPMA